MDRLQSSSLARSAIESALQRQQQSIDALRSKAAEFGGAEAAADPTSSFTSVLKEGLQEVDGAIKGAEQVHLDVVQGKLDFHEVAARLKETELTFNFAMQIRNRLIDSYREVMRMSV